MIIYELDPCVATDREARLAFGKTLSFFQQPSYTD